MTEKYKTPLSIDDMLTQTLEEPQEEAEKEAEKIFTDCVLMSMPKNDTPYDKQKFHKLLRVADAYLTFKIEYQIRVQEAFKRITESTLEQKKK